LIPLMRFDRYRVARFNAPYRPQRTGPWHLQD